MAEKKVVSIEDRIPQLKQARKKKANRRFFTYITVVLLIILVILYLQSPFSHIQAIQVENNRVVSEKEIKQLSGLSLDQSFWTIDVDGVIAKIESHQEIKEVSIDRKWYNQVNIKVNEYSRVGYIESNNLFYPVLENGRVLDQNKVEVPKGDAPVIYGFEQENLLQSLTQQLEQLNPSIVHLISEIYWDPSETNNGRIRMYMTDGQEVVASIHNFLDNMKVYPSISSQIPPGKEGILYIDVGAYFKPYDSDEEVQLESEESTSS